MRVIINEMDSTNQFVELILENNKAIISPSLGCALRSLTIGQKEQSPKQIIVGGDGNISPNEISDKTGSFLMIPWPNRILNGNLIVDNQKFELPVNSDLFAIHGLLRERPWNICQQTANSVKCSIDLQSPWPFKGEVFYGAKIYEDRFVQSISIKAGENKHPFPVGFGLHPWFKRDLGNGDSYLHIPGQKSVWILDENMVATGEIKKPEGGLNFKEVQSPKTGLLDHCFEIIPETTSKIIWPDILTLKIQSSANMSFLQVYASEGSLCVEPQSCAVDSFRLTREFKLDSGTIMLAPKQVVIAKTVWQWA